jgi:hypothetical protein
MNTTLKQNKKSNNILERERDMPITTFEMKEIEYHTKMSLKTRAKNDKNI